MHPLFRILSRAIIDKKYVFLKNIIKHAEKFISEAGKGQELRTYLSFNGEITLQMDKSWEVVCLFWLEVCQELKMFSVQ